MKNKNNTIFFFVILIIILGILISVHSYIHNSTSTISNSNINLSFAVLGDIHNNTDNFNKAIDDLHKVNPSMDLLILNGDTVDQGLDEQYCSIQNTLDTKQNLLPKKIIRNIGNHEFFDYESGSNSKKDVSNKINKYLKFSNEENVYHDTWIKNYHFISLGTEDCNSETCDSTIADIHQEQQDWLKEKLNEKYEKGKPIFVFLHQPFMVNFYTNNSWPGVKQISELKEVFSQYPEIILFTSHTHKNLDDSSININQPYTTVHTGAVGYTFLSNANNSDSSMMIKDNSKINGIYVEVYGTKVTIKGRNINKHFWTFTNDI